MNPENKQRIVGIVVLVAFVALLIPFLFTSGKKKEQTTTGNESIPIQTTDVNLSPDQQHSPGIQPTPVTGEQQPAALPGVTEDTTGKPALPENLQQPSVAPAGSTVMPNEQADSANGTKLLAPEVASSLNVPAPALGTEVRPEAAAPVTVDKTQTVISDEAKSEATKGVLKAKKSSHKNKAIKLKNGVKGATSSWSVQVGSFSDQMRMQRLVSKLQAKGFRVYLQKINTSRGLMVRVLVGREASKDKAAKVAKQLNATLKINGRIVGNKK